MRPIPLPEQPAQPTAERTSVTPIGLSSGSASPSNKWPLGLQIAAVAGIAAGMGVFALLIAWLVNRTPAATKKPVAAKAEVAEVLRMDPAEHVDVNPADLQAAEVNPAAPPVSGLPPMLSISSETNSSDSEQTTSKPPVEPQPKAPATPPAQPSVAAAKQPPSTTSTSPPQKALPPVKPFEGFPALISLPAAEPNKKIKLGPVRVPEDYLCTVYLAGGATASRERHELSLSLTPNSERDWELFAHPFNQSKSEKIADLSIKDQSLWLIWTSQAAENPAAGSFANCALKISAGSGTHEVLLRKPVIVGSIPVVYQKKTYDWELTDAPRTDKVQVEFKMTTPKTLPRARFVGSASVPVANGHTTIEFGLKAGERFLELQIDTKLDSRGVHVTVSPWVQVTGQDKPLALTSANVERLQQSLAGLAAPLAAQLKSLGNDKSTAERRAQLNRQLASIRRSQGELKQLVTLEKAFATQAQLAVTVSYVTDDVVVQLLKTQ